MRTTTPPIAGKLEYLDLTGAHLSDEGLRALAEGASMLENFYPGRARATTDEAWALLVLSCPRLKVVMLSACSHLSGAGGWHAELVKRGAFTGFDFCEGARPTAAARSGGAWSRMGSRWGDGLQRRIKGWVG